MLKLQAAAAALTMLLVAGCSSDGEITASGITITRSACPAVAIPAGTGDITLFNPPSSRDANAIDVVANITNVRSTCDESGEYIISNITFDIQALRRDTQGDREVVLPYFATVVHAGGNVVSKSVSQVGLRFADGQARASTTGSATGRVLASAAALPEDIRRQITRERKPGDADAAIDPMADPTVRAAVRNASYELLVGFQLTEEQLRYNATR